MKALRKLWEGLKNTQCLVSLLQITVVFEEKHFPPSFPHPFQEQVDYRLSSFACFICIAVGLDQTWPYTSFLKGVEVQKSVNCVGNLFTWQPD